MVDCGGYAQAAEALNKSQSSLNHAVCQAATESGGGPAGGAGTQGGADAGGEIFLKRARQLSQQVEELENLANNLERQWGRRSTSMCPWCSRGSASTGRWPLLPRSRGCRINLHERIHCHFNALRAGDLMLSEHLPQDRTGLPLDEVCLLPLCAAGLPCGAGRAHHRRGAGQPQPDKPASPIHRSVDWNDADDTGWKATHYHEVLNMVRLGMGYAWVPRHLVQEELTEGSLVQLRSHRRQRALSLHLPAHPSVEALGPAPELLLRCLRIEYQETTPGKGRFFPARPGHWCRHIRASASPLHPHTLGTRQQAASAISARAAATMKTPWKLQSSATVPAMAPAMMEPVRMLLEKSVVATLARPASSPGNRTCRCRPRCR